MIMLPNDLHKFLFIYCQKCAQRNEMYNDRYGRIFYCPECCEYINYERVDPSMIRFDTRKFVVFLKGSAPQEMKDMLLSLYMNMDKIDDVATDHESIQWIKDCNESKNLK